MLDFYKQKICLITGHRGFIGSALRRKLEELDARVVGLDTLGGYDVTHAASVIGTVDAWKPDVIFHLAAQTEVGKSMVDPHKTYMINFVGTLNILEAARKAKTPQVVVASSDKAYGMVQIPFKENRQQRLSGFCANPYGASKQAADNLCRDYRNHFDLPVTSARLCNVYGPGQENETTLITGTVRKLLNGESPIIHASDNMREWLYIDDAVTAYLLLGTISKGTRTDYNVGSGYVRRPSEVVKAVMKALKQLRPDLVQPLPKLVEDEQQERVDYYQAVDSTWFSNAFPSFSTAQFEVGIMETVQWYLDRWSPKEVQA